MTSGIGSACFIRSTATTNVVSQHDAAMGPGPFEQGWIAETIQAGLLHNHVIKLRQTQSQASKDPLVEVFVDEEPKHVAAGVFRS